MFIGDLEVINDYEVEKKWEQQAEHQKEAE